MQISQRSDILVVPTEKLKVILCMAHCDWLDVTDGLSDAHETGTTFAPGSCEQRRRHLRPPSEEPRSPVVSVDCRSPAAERLADYSQAGEKDGAGFRPFLLSRRTSSAARSSSVGSDRRRRRLRESRGSCDRAADGPETARRLRRRPC